mmetsp:Transcript_5250/g.6613  ORF Transcript_5250/g.6613 Transcript_5250/m.6613 type:complete len:436 (+) Transcript_5250:1-1308(+)
MKMKLNVDEKSNEKRKKQYKFTRRTENIKAVESNLILELPPKLINLLDRRDILKVGYGIKKQRNKLEGDWNVPLNGLLDLVNMFGEDYSYSLSQMCEYVLNVDWNHHSMGVNFAQPNSTQEIHFSDWQADELTQEQILYAANEAFASLKICETIQEDFKQLGKLDEYLLEIEKKRILKRLLESGHATVEKIRNEASGYPITVRDQSDFDILDEISDPKLREKFHKWKIEDIQERKNSKKNKQNESATTETFFYDNIELQDKEGNLLRMIDNKSTAHDYIEKGIARYQERALQSNIADETRSEYCYDRAIKHNICVCCGCSNKEKLTRASIIPMEKNKQFSHDNPLLCVECRGRWLEHEKIKGTKLDYTEKVVTSIRKIQREISLLPLCTCSRCKLTRHQQFDNEQRQVFFWRVTFMQSMFPRYMPFGWHVLYKIS